MDNLTMQTICKCGCGQPVKQFSDGRKRDYQKGHKAGITYMGVNTPTITKCGYCNAEITVQRWRLDKFGVCYCSRDHQKQGRSQRAIKTLTCEYCKVQFDMKPSKKQGNHVFCSLACFYKFHEAEPDKKIDVVCSGCGKAMRVYPSAERRNKNFYCSVDCRAKHIQGTNNPSFRSGMGRKREYSANWKKQRRATILRDNGRCQVCKRVPKIARYLHVHHIIPAYTFNGDWESANQLTNLITLCQTCHKKVERGKIAVQPKLV